MKIGNFIVGAIVVISLCACSKHVPATGEWLDKVVADSESISVGEWECSSIAVFDSAFGKLQSRSGEQIEFDFEDLELPGDLGVKEGNLQTAWSGGAILLRIGPDGWEGVVIRDTEPFLSEWYGYSAETLDDLRMQVAFTVRMDARQMISASLEDQWQVSFND